MPDLLLELRSEEIPARMQRKAAGDLKKLVTDGLVEAGLTYEAAREYWTPRRLALDIRGLTARSKDIFEERKGPSTKAPEQAIQGFLRSAGLASVEQAQIQSDPKKGDFYVARISKPGRAAEEIVASLLPGVIRAFPWPKSMRWGAASGPKGVSYNGVEGRGGEALRWVRPLQSILCTFGPETEEPVVVDFEVDGIRSGNVTYGHRFLAPDPITVKRFDDYVSKLDGAKVVLDADRRKEIILADAKNLAFASGLDLVEDEGLLEEVAGLVEWPVVLMGEFDADFLAIPAEVIRLTIRANQKCFVCAPTSPLRGGREAERSEGDAGGGISSRAGAAVPPPLTPPLKGEGDDAALSNRFIVTANIEASDGGAEIARGNGKVVRARLSDALYFWKTDQADLPDLDRLEASARKFGLDLEKPLDQRMARLNHLGVTFHAKLGTQGERVERIRRLAEELAPVVAKVISPLEGEMPGRAEGGMSGEPFEGAPPSGLPPISPSRGEISSFAARAAVLAKADLQTDVVGEFPELQGVMGRKYAALQGEHPSVAAAIEEHYKPQGPSDRVPTDPVSIAVALADKLDTLVGFWAIDEKPTGSKDPFALRRAALGVIRILVENGVRLGLASAIGLSWSQTFLPHIEVDDDYLTWPFQLDDSGCLCPVDDPKFGISIPPTSPNGTPIIVQPKAVQLTVSKPVMFYYSKQHKGNYGYVEALDLIGDNDPISMLMPIIGSDADLLSFFHDRLKVYLREQGARHDLIDAVLESGSEPSPLRGGSASARSEAESASRGGGGDEVLHPSAATQASPPPSALPGISPARGETSQSRTAEGRKPDRASARQAAPAEASERSERAAVSGMNDDLLMIVRRVEALGTFLDTEDGRNLLAGTKRAANILAAEEKKGTAIAAEVDPHLLREEAEKRLYAAVNQAESQAGEAIQKEDFSAAMLALSALREPVDTFFDKVLVNDEDPAIRANRLALLARIRAATGQVADFSRIAG